LPKLARNNFVLSFKFDKEVDTRKNKENITYIKTNGKYLEIRHLVNPLAPYKVHKPPKK
jgi:hypothetical protein